MSSTVLTGTQMVEKRFIEKRMQELTAGYMVTDAIFMRDASTSIAVAYEQNSGGAFDDKSNDVEQRMEGGEYPRIQLKAEEKQALIKDFGLSAAITYEAIKYNKIASINRAYILLGNSVIKYCDLRGLKALTDNYNASSSEINTLGAANAWSGATADPFADLVKAKAKVDEKGYNANVAVIHVNDWANAITNEKFRKLVDEDVPAERKIAKKGVLVGQVAGLTILVSNNIQQGKAAIAQDQVCGNRSETTNGVIVDVYKQNNSSKSSTNVDAFREVEYYLTDPKAVTLVSGL